MSWSLAMLSVGRRVQGIHIVHILGWWTPFGTVIRLVWLVALVGEPEVGIIG